MRTHIGCLALAFAFLCPFASAQWALDTVYTPMGYEDGPLTGTVYIPKFPNGVGVVLTHWLTADRQMLSGWCDTLAAHGYTAMTIDYYDFSSITYGIYPKPIRAFKIAVQFLRRNAARFNIASGRIVGLGQSEGALHWGQTIIWDNDYNYFRTDSSISDHLDAVVLFYGLYDNQKYLKSVIPVDSMTSAFFAPNPALRSTKGNCIVNVANITTPILLFHGTGDQVLQYEQSVQLHDSLIAHGKTCQLVLGPWGHCFDTYCVSQRCSLTPEGVVAKDTVLAFLQRTVLATSVPPD